MSDNNNRDKLITENINLAYKVTNDYLKTHPIKMFYGLTKEDLYQEASYALIKAADRYDPMVGAKFSTFAVICIKSELGYILKKSRSYCSSSEFKSNVTFSLEEMVESGSEMEKNETTKNEDYENAQNYELIRALADKVCNKYPKYKEIPFEKIIIMLYNSYKIREIAEELNLPIGIITSSITRIRKIALELKPKLI